MAQSTDNVTLFKKTEKKENSDDIWDDRALIRAYDRSIRKIKNELAQKFESARDTRESADLDIDEEEDDEFFEENEFNQENEGYYDEDEEDEVESLKLNEKELRKKDSNDWSIGDLCMAMYSEDGLLYPAKVIKIIGYDDKIRKKCLVKFLYYLNEEEKYLDELFELIGKKDIMTENNQNLRNFQTENNINNVPLNFQIPPPPLPGKIFNELNSTLDEKDAFHSMLLSWYMNGYHTGYYIGITQNKNEK